MDEVGISHRCPEMLHILRNGRLNLQGVKVLLINQQVSQAVFTVFYLFELDGQDISEFPKVGRNVSNGRFLLQLEVNLVNFTHQLCFDDVELCIGFLEAIVVLVKPVFLVSQGLLEFYS